jgi:hypothetical protein
MGAFLWRRWRPTLRRIGLGLSTVLGLRRRGWFIPYRYADQLSAPGTVPPYPAVERLLEAAAPGFLAALDQVDALAPALLTIASATRTTGPRPPRFDQGWFPTLDAAIAYTMLRTLRPARVIEIGSGHSTRFLARAASDGGFSCDILAIDPAPRADIDSLAGVRVQRMAAQAVAASEWQRLQPGDVLFVDSSHVLMPGSDVDFLFNRVLPELASGVIVHVHDVFLPYDYPSDWGWRNYNEQQAVVPLLTNGAWEPLFASHYAERHLGSRLSRSVVARLPRHAESRAASLWLRRSRARSEAR